MASQYVGEKHPITTRGGIDLQEQHSSSPSSPEGNQTLRGDSSPLVDVSPSVSSPISSSAEVGDLSAITSSPFWKPGAQFGPSNNARHEQPGPLAPRDLRSLRARNGHGFGHGSQAATFSSTGFRSSRTWISPEAQHQQEFLVIRNSMRRLFKNSEVAKWKFSDYTAHKEAVIEARRAALDRAVQRREQEHLLQAPQIDAKKIESMRKLIPGASMVMTGNTSRVLGMKTIWCHDWQNGKDEIAPWPSMQEMKWEGDDRAKTNCGRFLPLPREQGAQGILWSQLHVIEQYVLDQVQCIPTMEDIYAPIEEIEDEKVEDLLDSSILDALDESL